MKFLVFIEQREGRIRKASLEALSLAKKLGGAPAAAVIPGKGVTGRVDGREVALGNGALLAELGIDAAPLRDRTSALQGEGGTVMLVAVDGGGAGSKGAPGREGRGGVTFPAFLKVLGQHLWLAGLSLPPRS